MLLTSSAEQCRAGRGIRAGIIHAHIHHAQASCKSNDAHWRACTIEQGVCVCVCMCVLYGHHSLHATTRSRRERCRQSWIEEWLLPTKEHSPTSPASPSTPIHQAQHVDLSPSHLIWPSVEVDHKELDHSFDPLCERPHGGFICGHRTVDILEERKATIHERIIQHRAWHTCCALTAAHPYTVHAPVLTPVPPPAPPSILSCTLHLQQRRAPLFELARRLVRPVRPSCLRGEALLQVGDDPLTARVLVLAPNHLGRGKSVSVCVGGGGGGGCE